MSLPHVKRGASAGGRVRKGARRDADALPLEFGGSLTVFAIIVFSHFLIYWVFLSVSCNNGRPFPFPTNAAGLRELYDLLREKTVPTPAAVFAYLSYLAAMGALALVCPGPKVYGYPLPPTTAEVAAAAAGVDKRKQTQQKAKKQQKNGKNQKISSQDEEEEEDELDGGVEDERLGKDATKGGDDSTRGIHRRAWRVRNEDHTAPPPCTPPQHQQQQQQQHVLKTKNTKRQVETRGEEKEEPSKATSEKPSKTGSEMHVGEQPRGGGIRLAYRCNALAAWWVTLLTVAAATAAWGDAPLVWVADKWGELLTCAVVTADLVSIAAYVHAVTTGSAERMTGRPLYDFFMGAALNPRAFGLDLKMWSELRVSWITLFLLTLSAAAKQRAADWPRRGRRRPISGASLVMLTAHWLYTNACQKGEESVPFTWDIFHEKWGWMLIWWNLAGVPFVYCANSFFIAERDVQLSQSATCALLIVLLAAYYVWDTSQSQRTRFRMKLQGLYVRRPWAFPVLPWGTLESPESIDTAQGYPLLTSGWVGMARKIHYTADLVMATCWALACGSSPLEDPLPYFYPAFFLVMIVHRVGRDERRCREKYGRDWERYREAVPKCWIPGVV